MPERVAPFEREFLHVQQRAKERYHIVIDRSHYDHLLSFIGKGWCDTLWEEPKNRQRVVRIKIGKRAVAAVWDEKFECVTTLLPPEALKKQIPLED